ncbi:MAG: hypothetical protein JNJ58_05065 [Chitinophagaceae bacterium]|nr:hypothetical protein [Chitinophagaceae bacterium]
MQKKNLLFYMAIVSLCAGLILSIKSQNPLTENLFSGLSIMIALYILMTISQPTLKKQTKS